MVTRLDCSNERQVLNADSDIVGPGTLAAFLVSATITILAVVFAYLTEALDDSIMDALDYQVISRIRKRFRLLRPTDNEHSQQHMGEANYWFREARRETIARFILSLSDQQLVTGLAILIAGVSDPYRITGYEFSVILSLAWFSSTTHLTSLTALRNYFNSHGPVRNTRVLAMIVVACFLAYAFIVGTPAVGSTMPMECFPGTWQSLLILPTIAVLVQVLLSYISRIHDLNTTVTRPMYFQVVALWWKFRGMSSSDASQRCEEYAACSKMAKLQRIAHLERYADTVRLARFRYKVHSASYLYSSSFLSRVPGILFSFTYGVTQITAYRWSFAPTLGSESDRMTFGQVMPLLLLLLPLLAAGETWDENTYQRRRKTGMVVGTWTALPCSPPATTTPRATTFPQDPNSADERFVKNLPLIQKYFAHDIRFQIKQQPINRDEEVSKCKVAILEEYDKVRDLEDGLDVSPAIWLFVLDLMFWGLLGFLLNSSVVLGVLAFAASLLFTVITLGQFVSTVRDAAKMARS